MCEIDVAMWFLILASDTIMEEKEFDNALNAISSKFSMCFLIFEECGWKENQSEKESIRQFPELNSLLKTEKEGKSLLRLLSTSMSVDFK